MSISNRSFPNQSIPRSGKNECLVRLPTIKLPTFDGQYGNWLEFRDAFKALVDSNESLHNIQKFYYLRSSLEKDASQIIKAIEVSADNYKNAWQLLVDRYENKPLMIHNHIKAIFEHPNVNKESHTELRKLFDNVSKHLRSLQSLGENTDCWDRLIIYIITIKFDTVTRRDWESYKYENALPIMSDMYTFLKARCEVLEKLEVNKSERQKPQQQFNKKYASNSFVTSTNNYQCFYCSQDHGIYKCETFLALTINERIAAVKRLKLCSICLRNSHTSWKCKSQRCIRCNKPHNSLLHIDGQAVDRTVSGLVTPPGGVTQVATEQVCAVSAPTSSVNNHSAGTAPESPVASQVLLSTALIKIKNNENIITCRALLDSGSQSNFITENLCKRLELKTTRINHVVKGVGQTLAKISNQINITVMSQYNEFNININCLVLPKITEKLPSTSFDRNCMNIPVNLNLADPTFNISDEVDILLGSSVFWTILCVGQERLGKNLPVLQNTQLGWIISGSLYNTTNYCNISVSHFSSNAEYSIDDTISKFWQIEEVDIRGSNLSESEKYCENLFSKTTKRNSNGRFIVDIPFKESVQQLGNSREMAISRFHSLERRLARDAELRAEYTKFMGEYESLNHMSETCDTEQDGAAVGYYLPHHAVMKGSSLTTKCRVVYDASAKTDSGLSLNDVQFNGPTLQNDIFSILVRFRKHNCVVTADISKMYRQVLINEGQRKYQKIFWRSDANKELRCYRMNTVTYGTASAPYLAVRCLIQLGIDNEQTNPVVSGIIKDDFYVDDLLTGADTVAEVLQIQRDVSEILAGAGFELRKWLCNAANVVNKFHVNKNLDVNILKIGENEQNKTLGIMWNSSKDLIQYSINKRDKISKISKRTILSVICQIFDPLGLLGPIIIVAKLIIQELWKLQISWDEAVPQGLSDKWIYFENELPIINHLKIPRQVTISEYITIQLHGFSDASERAYGACIYIRCVGSHGGYSSKLVCAKSRVAPLKQLSLPRLELCGGVLMARLAKRVTDAMKVNFNKKYFWTDSTVTLAWIRGAPNRWKTFIANRVSEVQSLTNINNWHHVNSQENPADLLSRGTTPRILSESKLWWHGPMWLLLEESHWNLHEIDIISEIPEQRSVSNIARVGKVNKLELLSTFSSVIKVQRVLAYILRFISNARSVHEVRQVGVLTPMELDGALNMLIKDAQRECFAQEYNDLVHKTELNKKSKILALSPFLHNNLIHVGGRIVNSKVSFDKKHPIILPQGHRLTELILEHEHKRLAHCGAQQLLCSIREKYWPISGRNSCKGIIRKCVICFKIKPTHSDYLMGNLPDVRVNNYSPFLNVGVDYGGPVLLKDRKTRGAKLTKAYICLFICMSTKAVHIELVSELTAKGFLASLSRFVNRRGKPTKIYSDNGLNFVGANNELSKIYEFLQAESNQIANHLANQRIKWHFIPPRSPNFGGIWEAGIKSAKFHVKRVIGNSKLTFEEFNTILIQIEGILNSRPLCPLSPDPNDLTPLTPAHFLIGKSLTAIPEINMMEVPENRLDRYQRIQVMAQHYWSRWQKEYLAELQTRTKWKQRSHQLLKIGALVLVKNETAHTLDWQLGRITAVHPGSDSVIRVVDIKVREGEIRRAVSKICVLPVE